MRYLAILKDSWRESLDNKVIYVTLGMSCLAIVLVATLSFQPLSAEQTMRELVSGKLEGLFLLMRPEKLKLRDMQGAGFLAVANRDFSYRGVEAVRGPMDSPESDYRLTVSRTFSSAEEAAKVRTDPAAALQALRQQFATVEELSLLRIAEVRLAPPDNAVVKRAQARAEELFFEVHTIATPATRRMWLFQPSLFFGAVPIGTGNGAPFGVPLGPQLFIIANTVVSMGSWIAVLIGVIITGFFIPNMLRKGTVDLLLVKPIHRWSLLAAKYVGGLFFVLLNVAFAVVGMWLALGWRSGVWANSFLLMIFVLVFFFAILYAVSTLLAVMTRSPVVAILGTCGAWFIFFLVGLVFQIFDQQRRIETANNAPPEKRWSDSGFADVVRGVHFVLPRTSDLNQLGQRLTYADFLTGSLADSGKLDTSAIHWGESLSVSGVFIALMLGLACWWFATKDY